MPNDGSRLILKSSSGSFESISAKEKHFCQGKFNIGFSRHSGQRIADLASSQGAKFGIHRHLLAEHQETAPVGSLICLAFKSVLQDMQPGHLLERYQEERH